MNGIILGLLAAFWTISGFAATNRVAGRVAGTGPAAPTPDDPVEREYQKLLADDDAAQTEVDGWIKENEAFRKEGADYSGVTLNARLAQRFEPIGKAYLDFLLRHPEHVRARLAYGSFLNDTGAEDEAVVQWEKARELDPRNPAAWNNLADYYTRRGPVTRAFACLDRAIEINPNESVYYRNLATTMFLFRKEAMERYHCADEQQVCRRALELYRKARQFDPENFSLATDLAQVYYQLKPPGVDDPAAAKAAAEKLVDEALAAWLAAQKLARSELEREGVAIHLARVCLTHDRLGPTRKYLAEVKHPALASASKEMQRLIEQREAGEPRPPRTD